MPSNDNHLFSDDTVFFGGLIGAVALIGIGASSGNRRHHRTDEGPNYAESLDIWKNRKFHHPRIHRSHEIRLIRIIPGLSNSELECNFVYVTVDELVGVHYLALSYTWGSARSIDDLEQVIVDGNPFYVRKNLWRFLREMRRRNELSPIFIDAICISQSNIREKNEQVRIMSKIYQNANRVIIWLGKPQRHQLANLESLTDKFKQSHNTGTPIHQGKIHWATGEKLAFEYICNQRYWSRLWIVQEILLAKELVILFGPFEFDWEDLSRIRPGMLSPPFDEVWYSHLENLDGTRPPYYSRRSIEEVTNAHWGKALRIFDSKDGWDRRAPAFSTRSHRTGSILGYRSPDDDNDGMPLHQAIILFGQQDCHDPKDKLYALIGLLGAPYNRLSVDYNTPLRKIYKLALKIGLDEIEQQLRAIHGDRQWVRDARAEYREQLSRVFDDAKITQLRWPF
ncbi:HET-domain-containing protein [Rhizodiscina lignyota]|uniref:HET-domain-containing protein n=1 Tax=Rhizodiscina lignyota TaxID=1504668 RepID=A0A9P4IF59_9PEZI|nr:HET-domain-containing protein [Rhizodiscina lignyota]